MANPTPVPPTQLHQRVAGPLSDEGNYETNGRFAREDILTLLPAEWSWEGKRVLDFGCGPGRVLRHFGAEAEQAEFHGCDMHEPSIAWLRRRGSPLFELFVNDQLPPLPRQDSSFDLIWAISVFTHLTDSWSRWLLELHRLLDDGGLLIATFHGKENYPQQGLQDEPWCEDLHGMNILGPGTSWDVGGPAVFHSRWWLEAHWGRAFDIEEVRLTGFGRTRQGVLRLRKRDVNLTPEDLERPEPGEPREVLAARHNVRQLCWEIAFLTQEREYQAQAERAGRELAERLRTERDEHSSAHERLQATVQEFSESRSWRLTRPLRLAARAARRGRE